MGTSRRVIFAGWCMMAPDMPRMIFEDADILRGTTEELREPDLVNNRETIRTKVDPGWPGETSSAMTLGATRELVRHLDRPPQETFNWQQVGGPSDWGIRGGNGQSILGVFHENEPIEFGWLQRDGSNGRNCARFRHFVTFQLSGPVQSRGRPIRFTAPAALGVDHVGPLTLKFDDRKTNFPPARVPVHGFNPASPKKIIQLMGKVFFAPNEGMLDYMNDYGLTEVNLIDRAGATVYSAPVTLRHAASDTDAGFFTRTNNEFNDRMWYASTAEPPLPIEGITTGATTTITSTDHGWENGKVFRPGVTPGVAFPSLLRVKNATQHTFQCEYWANASSWANFNSSGTWIPNNAGGPWVDVLFPCYLANFAGTHVFDVDIGGFIPDLEGEFAIQVPGMGISDYFQISKAVNVNIFRLQMAGEATLRSGHKMDGRYGITRPPDHMEGYKGRVIWDNRCIGGWTTQTAVSNSRTNVTAGNLLTYAVGRTSHMIAGTSLPGRGGRPDAGDWDSISHLAIGYDMNFVNLLRLVPFAQWDKLVDPLHPKSSEVFPYEPRFALLDNAPAPLHAAIFGIEWQRRCMDDEGRVPGGKQGSSEGKIGWEPSWHASHYYFCHAPDHNVNYQVGAMLLELSVLIRHYSESLADEYVEQGMRAVNWAETVMRKVHKVSSATSIAIGTGNKSFGAVGAHLAIATGERVRAESRANTANFVEGPLVSYALFPGFLVINVDTVGGSGTFNDWDIRSPDYDKNYYYEEKTLMKRQVTLTGNFAIGSNRITNIQPNTSTLIVGDVVQAPGALPAANFQAAAVAIIASIDNDNEVTLKSLANGENYLGETLPLYASTAGSVAVANQSNFEFKANLYSYGNVNNAGARADGYAWPEAVFDHNVEALCLTAQGSRLWACAAALAATGSGQYHEKFITNYTTGGIFGWVCYLFAPGALQAHKDYCLGQIRAGSNGALPGIEAGQSHYAASMSYAKNPEFGIPLHHAVAMYFDTDAATKARRLNVLRASYNCVHGVNVKGLSLMTGNGKRGFATQLHDDTFVGGVSVGSPNGPLGQTLFGPAATGHFGHILGGINMWADTIAGSMCYYWQKGAEATGITARFVVPFPAAQQPWGFPKCRYDIGENEAGANMFNGVMVAGILVVYDGEAVADLPEPLVQFELLPLAA